MHKKYDIPVKWYGKKIFPGHATGNELSDIEWGKIWMIKTGNETQKYVLRNITVQIV
jgi:hypothetical protein